MGIISIIRGKKPGFSEKPGFLSCKPQVIERIRKCHLGNNFLLQDAPGTVAGSSRSKD
jgi:hypothetical protein